MIQEAANYHVELMAEHGESIPQPVYSAIEVEVEVPTPEALQRAAVKKAG